MAYDRKSGPTGVIGLGFIGTALVERLLDAGFEVIGYDVDRAKAERLAGRGVRTASSVLELGRACRTIVVAVFNTAQVIDVIEGEGGLIAAAEGGEITVICISTCEPDAIATLARRAAALGVAVIEFPLSGHSEQVRAGDATGLIAGDAAAIARVDAVMGALCPRRFEIGKPGDAARAKLAVNLVSQLNRCALAEGLVFAARMGLDPAAFLKVLSASPARSDVMDSKGEKMVAGDYTPQSRIAQTLKDAQLILEEARRVGQPLPLMEINTALLAASVDLGGPDRDSSAIIEAIRSRG
jgi:3-hydroxyisobutyrate dehydrogenase-like beta-hydroxyacid dehydrogenase